MNTKALRAAFNDELQKIATEFHGMTRSGRRPISAEKLLAKDNEQHRLSSPPNDSDEGPVEPPDTRDVEKRAAGDHKAQALKGLALVSAGALGMHGVRKVNRRYQMGKQMEYQQMGY